MIDMVKQLVEAAEEKTDRVVELTSELVKFNTTCPNPGEDPFDDRECQGYIAEQLKSVGFDIDLWEPDIERLSHYPFYIKGQSFKNRPILGETQRRWRRTLDDPERARGCCPN